MNIKHIWSVLCRESLINKDDNVISLNGVLEQLTVGLKPDRDGKLPEKVNIPINYEIVSFWIKEVDYTEEAKADIEIKLLEPGGKKIIGIIKKMIIPKNIKRFRSRMKIAGLTIVKKATIYFRVVKKRKKKKIL